MATQEVKYNQKCKYCGLPGLGFHFDKKPKMRFPNGDGHEYETECKEIQASEDREAKYAEVTKRHMRDPGQVPLQQSQPAQPDTTVTQQPTAQAKPTFVKNSPTERESLAKIADMLEIVAKYLTEKQGIKTANQISK